MSDEHDMAEADSANGEGRPDGEPEEHSKGGATNDTEERYGEDESPA